MTDHFEMRGWVPIELRSEGFTDVTEMRCGGRDAPWVPVEAGVWLSYGGTTVWMPESEWEISKETDLTSGRSTVTCRRKDDGFTAIVASPPVGVTPIVAVPGGGGPDGV